MNSVLKQNCRYFKPDVPCAFHKDEQVTCGRCAHFSPLSGVVLIVKREAVGDVLRTTCLLKPLKKKFPRAKIVWFPAESARPALEGNPYIDEIWSDDFYTARALDCFHFSAVANLDLARESLLVAGTVSAGRRFGFWYDRAGRVRCSNAAARRWLKISHDDGLKKKNTATYQRIAADIIAAGPFAEIVVPLTESSLAGAEDRARRWKIRGKNAVGINVGSGNRWITKRWPEQNILKLLRLIGPRRPVVLFGGVEEKEAMERIVKASPIPVINAGWNNSLPDFFALLNLCSTVVTADTLALHAAAGLGKKVIALFGPTSAAEIETYGRVCKIVSPAACRCCYKRRCGIRPSCMEMITPGHVFEMLEQTGQ
jgi:heptosyltransferase-2